MKYYRVAADGSPRLAVRTADTAYDPTSAKAELTSFSTSFAPRVSPTAVSTR